MKVTVYFGKHQLEFDEPNEAEAHITEDGLFYTVEVKTKATMDGNKLLPNTVIKIPITSIAYIMIKVEKQ